jgi:type IV secretory pathway VirB10-like protein
MTVSRDAAGAYVVGRKTLSAMCVVGLLTALGACAAENAAGVATPASATAAAPAATPAAPAAPPAAAATTAAAAPKPAPQVLTPTEINEQCWMSNELNKMKDLDAKAKFVDKCVAEKMKAQGM